MAKRILTTLLFAFSLALSSAEAVQIKAIYLVDSNDATIGLSARSDLAHMQSLVGQIADSLALPLEEITLSGRNHIHSKGVDAINNLQVDPDDIVIFYFSGHGFRVDSKEDQWPALFYGFYQPALDFNWVANTLKAKNPRLLLAIAEVCNNVLDEKYAPEITPRLAARKMVRKDEPNYAALFLDNEGSIIIATSKPGTFAWGTDFGGLYTTAFIKNLLLEVQTKQPSWEAIIQKTSQDVIYDEEPIYELDLI